MAAPRTGSAAVRKSRKRRPPTITGSGPRMTLPLRGSKTGSGAPARTVKRAAPSLPPARSAARTSSGPKLPASPAASRPGSGAPTRAVGRLAKKPLPTQAVAHGVRGTAPTRKLAPAGRPKAVPRRGPKLDLPAFVGEVSENVRRAIPSVGPSGIVPHTIRNLPPGGVQGVLKRR